MNKASFSHWLRDNTDLKAYTVNRYANAIDIISCELEVYDLPNINLYEGAEPTFIKNIQQLYFYQYLTYSWNDFHIQLQGFHVSINEKYFYPDNLYLWFHFGLLAKYDHDYLRNCIMIYQEFLTLL